MSRGAPRRRETCPALTQELHYEAAREVSRRLCQGEEAREALLAEAAPLTEARADTGRRRAAAAVLTRLGLGRRRRVRAAGLHRLLASLDERASRQLWAYVVASCEPMLAGIAREVLYPYFVQCRPPEGFAAEEFSAINANGLFEVAGAVTHAAVGAFARRRWGISDPAPTGRALRLLRRGGVLEAAWVSRSSARCLGYFPGGGLPDPACLAYAIYSTHGQGGRVRVDRLRAGLFVHLFLLRPIAVDFLLERAIEQGWVGRPEAGVAALTYASLDAAVEALVLAQPPEAASPPAPQGD
jgi:hypothetical protein